jgi:exonuclease SbcC
MARRPSVRPERLVLEGFSTFRDRTEVDFVGADLFALTGPTGAGKSSIIDAIVFALYGSIPRLDDKRVVAPVISQDKVEAKVQLDFSIDGVGYRAVRVVREQAAAKGKAARGSGRLATTKEARLERVGGENDGEVLAGNADELTDAVTKLLGLSFEHFTTCVVLPQGQFARFLHHKARDRQDLLVELLDLGVYGQMGSLARARAAAATQQVEWLTKEREGYEFASTAAADSHRDRVAAIERLLQVLGEMQPRLDEVQRSIVDHRGQAADAGDVLALLASVEIPTGVDDLASLVTTASAAIAAARQAAADTATALIVADRAVDELPDRSSLELAKRDHEAAAAGQLRIERGQALIAEAAAVEAHAIAEADQSTTVLHQAEVALEQARVADRAADLARHLVVGEPCPVCGNEVHELTEHGAADLRRATKAEQKARQSADAAAQARVDATSKRTRLDDHLTDVRAQRAELDQSLVGAPPLAGIDEQLVAIEQAGSELKQRRVADRAARAGVDRAERELADAEARAASGWSVFDAARDRLAVVQPPAADRADLSAAWRTLRDWAGAEHERYTGVLATINDEIGDQERHRGELVGSIRSACTDAGVEVGADRPPRDAAVEALAEAKADVASIEAALARLTDLDREVGELTTTAEVDATLGRHLAAKGFEKWVLDEALERLVAGASGVLYELSGQSYSLVLDASSTFFVKDHKNADAMRPARTLSGGETFLASLALALALADQVAELAAGGAVRLESIFLDEGFGTLDADTLDTVATAIEELGASGRMVGLVSHVTALAERMPVRFMVTKGPTTSTVERLDS